MAGWLERKDQLTIPGDKFYKLRFETPDEGGKLGVAIEDGLMRLYKHQAEKDIFGMPKLVLKSKSVVGDTGGQLGIGTGEISQGKPIIEIPPARSGKVYTTPPDPADPMKKTVLVQLDLEQGAIILHEVNHSTHRFVNGGRYMHPKSSEYIGAVDQNIHMGIMSRALQVDRNISKAYQMKVANEVETYWLCCCDAAKYHFSEDAIMKIKEVNNQNLLAAGYAHLANEEQAKKLEKHMDDHKLWANMFNVEDINPVTPNLARQDAFDELKDDDKPQM